MKMEEVLRLLPHDVRGIGEEVLNAMICGPKVLSWTDKLELRIMGDVVPGTNLVHLLEYILYPEEEDSEPPRGFEQFLKGLKKSNSNRIGFGMLASLRNLITMKMAGFRMNRTTINQMKTIQMKMKQRRDTQNLLY